MHERNSHYNCPKSRPGGIQNTLYAVCEFPIKKIMVLASFVYALSKMPRCNIIVKTLVFLKILSLSLLPLLLVILSRGDFKQLFKFEL